VCCDIRETSNVLQYRETYCDVYRSLNQACSILNADAPLYSLFRVDANPVSCELRGPFTFTYSRGHGECQYPLSTIDSCTDDSHLLFRFLLVQMFWAPRVAVVMTLWLSCKPE
ncbi:uncharacterized protein CEXT_166691, partial [Caerostris extrusa]